MTRDERMTVLLAQQGDRGAMERLLERAQTRLFRYIAGVLASPGTAEDVLQETLLRIATRVRRLDDPDAFDAWAYRIASREIYRALGRARAPHEPIADDLPASEPIPPRLTGDELARMVDALSPASRAVVVLHYQEERSLEEIAAVLGIPLGTVKSRLAYGLRCLREGTKP
jgi:RNA polymerase sigma-70 factor (ECF subfamily)